MGISMSMHGNSLVPILPIVGYPGAELAWFLGVTTSSVNRLPFSEEAVNLTKYLKLF
jgi:hypothetical protein